MPLSLLARSMTPIAEPLALRRRGSVERSTRRVAVLLMRSSGVLICLPCLDPLEWLEAPWWKSLLACGAVALVLEDGWDEGPNVKGPA